MSSSTFCRVASHIGMGLGLGLAVNVHVSTLTVTCVLCPKIRAWVEGGEGRSRNVGLGVGCTWVQEAIPYKIIDYSEAKMAVSEYISLVS